MKNAFIAIIIITPLFGLLSTMVVSNKMSFFADSLGHGAFTGIAVGILLDGIDPMWGATLFSISFAIAITIIKNKGTSSTDTIIGVFSSTSIALGLVLMSFSSSLSKFSSYLVGDLLSISHNLIILFIFVFKLYAYLLDLLRVAVILAPIGIINVSPYIIVSYMVDTILIRRRAKALIKEYSSDEKPFD